MPMCQDRRGEFKDMQYLDTHLVELHYQMPLNEIIYDFFDTLKANTKGYASLDYELSGYRTSDLVKVDLLLNGEKQLGTLYRKGDMATVRREWRGIKDTAYDFYEWARMWGMLLMTFSKDLIPALNGMLYYRWYVSYFCCHGFMDKCLMGMRGSNLRMSHEVTYNIFLSLIHISAPTRP